MSDDLVKRIDALEAELKAAKEAKAKADDKEELPAYFYHIKRNRKAEEPVKPAWPKYDPTEQMTLPPSAAKAMAAVVPDPPKEGGFSRHGWEQNKGPGDPGGFGSPNTKPAKPVERSSGWVEPSKLDSPPGLKYVDQQLDVADAIDKAALKRRLGGD